MTRLTARSERGLRPERAAEIIVGPPGGARRGSGYLVGPGRVLTAAHVVADADTAVVRFQAHRPEQWAAEATVAWTHDGLDIAVLILPDHENDDVPPVSFGRAGDQDAVLACTAMGFPRFKLRTDEAGRSFRDTEHMDARCAVLANRREGTLDLRITAPPAEDPDPERDAWEGMSGAAVFSGGYLVGVASRHHSREGAGRIAAGRVDRWTHELSTPERGSLEKLLGCDLAQLPSAAPLDAIDLVQEVYRAQLADIAPQMLDEREAELADLVAFCGGEEPYRWHQGRPWAGKTALAAWFALHPPRGVVPVWFFITARYAGQSDGDAYTAAFIDQLATIAGREPATTGSPAARDGERRLLLRQAAERVAQDGGTLLLVVDGLDEDQSLLPGGSGTSIASLLPERPPPNVRVLVTSRPNPGIPADVGGGHPLRHCQVVELTTSAAARHTEHEAKYDLQRALGGDRLERDVVGLLAAARGTLTAEDLWELTGESSYTVRRRLASVFGRILRLRGGGGGESSDGDVTMYTTSRGYLFAHETLLAAAQDELGPDIEEYWSRLHAWAEGYEHRGWPEATPLYLLQPYGRLVALLQDARRITALAVDPRRRDRLREATGSDAACLAEIAVARETVLRATPDDLGELGALAAVGDLVARRNESLHPDVPAVYARLGRVRQAIGLARSVFRHEHRVRAVLGVAQALAESGDRRAVELAEEAVRLTEDAVRRTPAFLSMAALNVRGMRARALALAGREEEAVQVLREVLLEAGEAYGKDFVKVLLVTAAVLKNPAGSAELLRLAEKSAERLQLSANRISVLVNVADAWEDCGFPEDATRLHSSVSELAMDTKGAENLPAAAWAALRDRHPDEAARMAAAAAAKLDEDRQAGRGPATPGDVCALVAMDRMPEAQRLAESVAMRGPQEAQLFTWTMVAEGWARRGAAAEAWTALEMLWQYPLFEDRAEAPRRVAGLLAGAGAAEHLEATLLGAEYSASTVLSWWAAAEAFVVLAEESAADDPPRALELLRTAEEGRRRTDGLRSGIDPERLVDLAGAVATADRWEDAERLMETLPDSPLRARGLAVVSLAVARRDPGRALRLAEEAVGLSLTRRGAYPSPVTVAVQALGWAGAAERVVEVLDGLRQEEGDGPPRAYDHHRACAEAAAGLWPHDPELARRLEDEALRDGHGDLLATTALLLGTVASYDSERRARLERLLATALDEHRVAQTRNREVPLALLTATTDAVAACSRLDAVVADEQPVWNDRGSRSAAPLVYAALGDHETARAVARRGRNTEECAEALAHLAAYTAGLPADRVPVPFWPSPDVPLLTRRLATLLFPPSAPDLPRARSLLAEALTPDGWHHAAPVLAAIDPEAVLRIRHAVFAHLGLGD